MNLNKLVVEPVGMWAKRQAVGTAPRCPRIDAVPRRGMVHMPTGCARFAVRCAPSQLFTQGKELGWRDIDKHWLVFTHQTNQTEFSPIPVPSVD